MTTKPLDPNETLERMIREFASVIPHNQALGLKIVSMEDGRPELSLPYCSDLVGNPESGVLHGGPITSLLDAATGLAVFMRLREPASIATLDLRVDYLTAAPAGKTVFAVAECYRTTRNIAFARGFAHMGDRQAPIASVVGTFMLGTRRS